MRREYINFYGGIPLNISLINFREYPFHWHDCMEILYVLKGEIFVTIDTESFTLKSGEVEIINIDEAHSINSKEDNLVLLFNIDTKFLKNYYEDIDNVFFYTDNESQEKEEKYDVLKRYLANIFYEVIKSEEEYEIEVQSNLISILFHLVNEFHYLTMEDNDLKEKELQMERYHRITKYIYNNYMNKISLKDIADKEFLSLHYLSHELKNKFGYGFQEILNLTRIEESIKLLLDTNKSISDIALECGFSHARYFNKHFKYYYNCSPTQFRKKYKFDEKELEKLKIYSIQDLEEAIPYLISYIEDYEEENINYDEIQAINIDLEQQVDFDEKNKLNYGAFNYIEIGKIHNVFNKDILNTLKKVQNKLNFKYGILNDVFSLFNSIEDIYNFSNFLYESIKVLKELNICPIIEFTFKDMQKKCFLEILQGVITYLKQNYGEDFKFGFKLPFNLEEGIKNKIVNAIKELDDNIIILIKDIKGIGKGLEKETNFMAAYLLHKFIEKGQNNIIMKSVDEDYPLIIENKKNFIFQGEKGLTYSNGLKKPSYFAYSFFSQLGDIILDKGKGYIVTKKQDDIEILLYNYMSPKELSKISNKNYKNLMDFVNDAYSMDIWKETTINVLNLDNNYKLIRYELTKEQNCPYDNWNSLGKPQLLTSEEIDLIKNINHPKVNFEFVEESSIYSIKSSLEPFAIELIKLIKL